MKTLAPITINQLHQLYNSYNRPMDSFIAEEMASIKFPDIDLAKARSGSIADDEAMDYLRFFHCKDKILRNYDRLMKGEVRKAKRKNFVGDSCKKFKPIQLSPEMLCCSVPEPTKEYHTTDGGQFDKLHYDNDMEEYQSALELVLFDGWKDENRTRPTFTDGVNVVRFQPNLILVNDIVHRGFAPHQLHELGAPLSEQAIKIISG